MTAIVGLVDNGRVLIGGDSAGVDGYQVTVRRDAKVFTNGAYVFGFTDSFRMGQLLRYALQPPPPPAVDLDRFLATTWVDVVRETLRKGGWSKLDGQQEQGGRFLVGVQGRLFAVDGDFQVGEPSDGYDAVGCGAEFCLGALHATRDLDVFAEDRALLALRAAAYHSAGVVGPFNLVWEDR